MFCTKCGREVDNTQFCIYCGSKLNAQTGNSIPKPDMDKDYKSLLPVVFTLLSGILPFTGIFKTEILWAEEGVSLFALINNGFITAIFVVLYLIALGVMVCPQILQEKTSRLSSIIPLCVLALTLIAVIFVMIVSIQKASEWGADFAPSFTGILLFVSLFCGIYLLSKDIKNCK